MCRIPNLEAGEEDHTEYQSCQLRALRLQIAQVHQNSFTERVLISIWPKQHESVDPTCVAFLVPFGGDGVMVQGIFWYTLGL